MSVSTIVKKTQTQTHFTTTYIVESNGVRTYCIRMHKPKSGHVAYGEVYLYDIIGNLLKVVEIERAREKTWNMINGLGD